MSLQGSLETIALPDVLSLLASSGKTGELRITGRIDGRLWLQEGKLIGSSSSPAASLQGRRAPEPDHVDAVFQLLRLSKGEFLFQEGAAPSEPGEMCAVDSVVRMAQERLAEWRVIEAAIPSLDGRPRLRSDPPGSSVTLPANQWRMVVAIAGGTSVRDTLETLGVGEFDGCRLVKDLIDGGLVNIEVPPVRMPALTTANVAALRAARPPVVPGERFVAVTEGFAAMTEPAPERRRPAEATFDRRRPLAPVDSAGPVAPHGPAVAQPAGPLRPIGPDAAQGHNGRSAPAAAQGHNGRSAPAAAAAVVALQSAPVRPRPAVSAVPPVPTASPSPLEEAVAAAMAASPPAPAEAVPMPRQVDPNRARRARRVAATRDDVLAAQARQVRPVAAAPAPPPPPAPAPAAAEAAPEAPPEKEKPGDEPINRGLLLKFLSSVRS